jgi:hypothetical protein
VHPWLNIILHPVFSLPKPAQVTSVVPNNIGPRNAESNKRFIRFGHETEAEPYFLLGFISDGAWFYSFLRVLRHDFCSIVSNERFLIQNRVIEAFPTPKAEK